MAGNCARAEIPHDVYKSIKLRLASKMDRSGLLRCTLGVPGVKATAVPSRAMFGHALPLGGKNRKRTGRETVRSDLLAKRDIAARDLIDEGRVRIEDHDVEVLDRLDGFQRLPVLEPDVLISRVRVSERTHTPLDRHT